jgi:nickel-type superoxide dismutase maturation protease
MRQILRRLWPLGLYRVAGESMQPTHQPGDTLLGLRWFALRPGQVVVARQAGRPIIKRVAAIDASGIHLAGDHPARSTDSRHFGPVSRAQIEARIIAKLD